MNSINRIRKNKKTTKLDESIALLKDIRQHSMFVYDEKLQTVIDGLIHQAKEILTQNTENITIHLMAFDDEVIEQLGGVNTAFSQERSADDKIVNVSVQIQKLIEGVLG